MNKYDALKQYKELFENEIITQQEFDTKKKELLALPDEVDVKKDDSIEKRIKEAKKKADEIKKAVSEKSSMVQKTVAEKAEENEKKKAERKAAREEKKKNRIQFFKRKPVKITLIVLGILIVACIAFKIISNAMLPDLSKDMAETQESIIHDMKFEVPKSWEKDSEKTNNVLERYIKYDDNKNATAFLEVAYMGEDDLSGDASVNEEHAMPDDAEDIIANCSGLYQTVFADNAVFEITVYRTEGEVKGESALLDDISETMDVENYNNPRKSIEIKAKYSGETKAGTIIDDDCEDILVYEVFDTGVDKGNHEIDWTIDKSVKLKAGEKSTILLHTATKDVELKVECSTLSKEQYKAKCKNRNYKNQLRKESFGDYIKIYGKVLQDCGSGYFRIGTSGSGYDDVYMVLASGFDIVEDDWVTCYGITSGIYEYETVMGANQKVPSMIATYVER